MNRAIASKTVLGTSFVLAAPHNSNKRLKTVSISPKQKHAQFEKLQMAEKNDFVLRVREKTQGKAWKKNNETSQIPSPTCSQAFFSALVCEAWREQWENSPWKQPLFGLLILFVLRINPSQIQILLQKRFCLPVLSTPCQNNLPASMEVCVWHSPENQTKLNGTAFWDVGG